jgi:hypothetical protein
LLATQKKGGERSQVPRKRSSERFIPADSSLSLSQTSHVVIAESPFISRQTTTSMCRFLAENNKLRGFFLFCNLAQSLNLDIHQQGTFSPKKTAASVPNQLVFWTKKTPTAANESFKTEFA